jgi:hypothetical protein
MSSMIRVRRTVITAGLVALLSAVGPMVSNARAEWVYWRTTNSWWQWVPNSTGQCLVEWVNTRAVYRGCARVINGRTIYRGILPQTEGRPLPGDGLAVWANGAWYVYDQSWMLIDKWVEAVKYQEALGQIEMSTSLFSFTNSPAFVLW